MKYLSNLRFIAVLAVIFAAVNFASAQPNDYRISAPYTYKNLTIFLLHGKDQDKKGNVMTLQEAMERKLFVVYETGNVNELEVENLSKELDVFIQSGDIVKGGKQDRVLAVSIIIPARSGRIKIDAFCVESGRWEKRGSEDAKKFTSSNDRIVTKGLKIAANTTRSQQEVWSKVAEAQGKLSTNVGDTVASPTSRSSLQLSLENKKIAESVDAYINKLSSITHGKSDVIGYAMAINGKMNSADVYVSNALFKKLWTKMLRAAATEAVAESKQARLAAPVKADSVRALIDDSEKARSQSRTVGAGRSRIVTREDKDNVMTEAYDEKRKQAVHKSYVRKD